MRGRPVQTQSARAGFALMEATAALFVAAVGVFGVVQMFTYGADKLDAIHEQDLAGRILQNELETLRAQPFDALPPGTGRLFVSNLPELDHLMGARTWTDIRPYASRGDSLLEVTVHIRWITEHGRPAHRELTTLIAKGGADA